MLAQSLQTCNLLIKLILSFKFKTFVAPRERRRQHNIRTQRQGGQNRIREVFLLREIVMISAPWEGSDQNMKLNAVWKEGKIYQDCTKLDSISLENKQDERPEIIFVHEVLTPFI